MNQRAKTMLSIAVVAAVYYLGGSLGLRLAFVHESASAVWPPTGIALAALLVLGYRVWPAITIGAFAVNFAITGAVLASLGIAVGNTLEGLAGTYLVNRLAGGRDAFDRAENVLRYTLYAGVIACAIGATLGAVTLDLTGRATWPESIGIWLTWWMGDFGGAMVLAPVLLLWSRPWRMDKTRTTWTEAIAVVIFALATGWLVFDQRSLIARSNFPLAYLCILPAVWMAMRFGRRVTSVAVLVLGITATASTISGFGVFAVHEPTISLLLVQAFVISTAVTSLTVASSIYERRQAEAELKASHENLERRVLDRTGELFAANAALRDEVEQRQRAEEATQRLSRRLLQLQDEERRRMARELHDSTAQQLAALEMQLAVLDDHARDLNPAARAALQESHSLAESATREVRTLSYLLHPPLLDEAGLASALDWYTEGFATRSRIETELHLPENLGRLPREIELAVFRIVQESLVNVHRHSGGTRASIRLARDNGGIMLQVVDDGRGIDPAKNRGALAGVGITGMRERVHQLGGKLEISSSDKGTTVTARIPLDGN